MTPEEVLPDIFRLEIPLPRNPLRAVNAYVVRGGGRWLMIDTGMNRPECLDAVRAGLAALGVDLGRTDFFITHGHSDHVGLVSELAAPGSRIFMHARDAAILANPELWSDMAVAARTHGFPDPETAVMKHPGRKYLFSGQPRFTHIAEGDRLPVGKYAWRCVETPGHTPGHVCLHDAERRILVSGDHILATITPNISGWVEGPDPLGDFLASLGKVAAMEADATLPAHRGVIRDHRGRVAELKAHHRARMQEALDILARGPRTAYQVAAEMTWSIGAASWDDFPVPQQWFATGEALSHLLHLEKLGKIR
ncbi:MAG: MBL fold metallo-hydrolase, partial [Candidatus Methylomirabilales bacterium]